MNYQMFVDEIKSRMEKSFGDEYCVYIHDVAKNNVSGEHSMTILRKGSNLSPAILLEPFYRSYLEGTSLDEIAEQIGKEYRSFRMEDTLNVDFIKNWNFIKKNIVCRIIGAEKNQGFLKNVPHESVLDMAVVYYYQVFMQKDRHACMLISNEHLQLWGVSGTELKTVAAANTRRLLPPEFFSMKSLFADMPGDVKVDEGNDLYVLTNPRKLYGAYWLTQEDALKRIRSKLGEDYLILPSSVHEAIILPDHMEAESDKAAEIVACINRTEVAREEVLTNSVYSYRKGRGLALEVTAKEGGEQEQRLEEPMYQPSFEQA